MLTLLLKGIEMKSIRIKDDPNRIDSVKFLEELRAKDVLVKENSCEETPISASKAVILARGTR